MVNILVTGASGQLGLELASIEKDFPNYNFFFTTKKMVDITNFEAVSNFVSKNNSTTIINCAAYTNVDKAEDEPNLADEVNHLALKNLAKIAKTNNLKLIHISTDYVFDGNSNKPYTENDIPNPQNVYGRSKLRGEEALLEVNPDNSVIIRTSWLYSQFGNNFVKTMLRLGKEKNTISVVSDQIGSPTYAADLAKAILQLLPLIKSNGVQTYHFANKGACSWFQFAEEIMKVSNSNCKVLPISSSEFKATAKRPNFSLLATKKIENDFSLTIPHWKNALEKCVLKLI